MMWKVILFIAKKLANLHRSGEVPRHIEIEQSFSELAAFRCRYAELLLAPDVDSHSSPLATVSKLTKRKRILNLKPSEASQSFRFLQFVGAQKKRKKLTEEHSRGSGPLLRSFAPVLCLRP